ncbi:Maf family protein [Actinocrinis sp.]|uniref:Maf family protein n=1 Tax=Actinocrinis sp. TaxID=1920516 RepID=UPI002BAC3891|nr:Maf family protein [Actinocrinis sp.]HXR70544.1 Maf family protein [Actinocrinis sp.]
MRLVLASQSTARLTLLRNAGFAPEAIVSGVDEDAFDATSPVELALILARAKARAVAQRVEPGALVIGCDSVLDLDGGAFGKPTDVEDAIGRWKAMRGRQGILVTGHCLIDTRPLEEAGAVPDGDAEPAADDQSDSIDGGSNSGGGGSGSGGSGAAGNGSAGEWREVTRAGATLVQFAEVSDAEIEAYVATGEPLQVAGAFTLDGIGGSFVESIGGDPSNVIGLSLPLLRGMLAEFGISVADLWSDPLKG